MSEEIINALEERAKEMLKGNNIRQIGAEEIITILREYRELQKENEELKMQNENLYQTIKENTNAEELLEGNE